MLDKLADVRSVMEAQKDLLEFKKVRVISLSCLLGVMTIAGSIAGCHSYKYLKKSEVHKRAMEKGYVQNIYRDNNGYIEVIWVKDKTNGK